MTEVQTTVDNWVEQAEAIERGEAPSGSKVFALTGPKSVTSPGGPDKPAGETYKTQHGKVLRFEISVGNDDDVHTIEQFEQAVRMALNSAVDDGRNWFTFNTLTTMGSYYIIDGKVCLPHDYDPATKNRKPGTFPPSWAGGPDPKKATLSLVTDDTDDAGERDFVRVQPTKPRRDPVTGVKPRKPRSDKGVKKGARKTEADKVAASDAIARMRTEGLNR
jgi:hypothetical protein